MQVHMLKVRKAALRFTPTTLRYEDANCVMDTNEVVEHSSGRHKSSFEQNVGMSHRTSQPKKNSYRVS